MKIIEMIQNVSRSGFSFSPHLKGVIVLLLVGLALQGTMILGPHLTQRLIDTAYQDRDRELAVRLVAALIATLSIAALIRPIQAEVHSKISTRISSSLCVHLHDYIHQLPYSFMDGKQPGEITSRFQSLRNSVAVVLKFSQVCCNNLAYLAIVPFLLWKESRQMALIVLISMPVFVYLAAKQARSSYHHTRAFVEQNGLCDGFQTEIFGEMACIKGLQLEGYSSKTFAKLVAKAQSFQRGRARSSIGFNFAINGTRTVITSICVYLGWRHIIDGTLGLGEYTAFVAYLNYLYNPLVEVVNEVANLQTAQASLERALVILNERREETRQLPEATECRSSLLATGVSIEMQDIFLSYGNVQEVLSGVTLNVGPGAVVAITGKTGAGKTSLFQLMLGFRTPSAGRIAVDGRELTSMKPSELRTLIAVVWQEPSILSGSLLENLLPEQSNTSMARVWEVIRMCCLEDLAARLPNGLDTQIGHSGIKLSGGEKQRISIARALLRNRPVLLLDEPTAYLDEETGRALIESVRKEYRERSLVMITHQLSLLALSNSCFELSRGRLVPIGSLPARDLPQRRNVVKFGMASTEELGL